ncbi:phage tail tape measure protein [Pseudomonas sp. C2B4]|uniref:phage tail tape measure protein n=1 Tax=Pseudomonas sp. C2B4 TaxID=2735270 RepID=UPI00158698B2|nr:phage tail tape measure protein [Pseudomonas sp. C2B4]NUU35154.1 phage tail tape measure protein [Pseudomonas sp. C2B4]
MAGKLALALEIGGAVNSSLGAAFSSVEGRIKKLEDKGNRTKVLKNTIGETMRLRDEWKKAHDSGVASASSLLRKLEGNLDSLRKQGVQVGNLRKEYQQLQRVAKATDLQLKGQQQIEQGKSGLKSNLGQAVVGIGALGVAGKVSADYQAIIRDIAIKSNVANQPQEAEMSRTVIQTAQDTGMARNDVAELVNQLVGAGMELDKALAYAPVAAKFAIGQGSSGVDTASMIQALQQNAKITDPKEMQKALEAIAMQGQAGSFEAADMAKWFPQLLAGMEKNGSTGLDAVTSLGAMLQVQMKTAGGSDEAANNLKNWMEKIGSGDVVKAYKDAGIDYQSSLNTGIQNGMSTLESSFALAMKYVQATDPAKAAKMAEAQAKISKETDPEKAKAMLEALEKSLRTGDLFADMQVKAALTAYSANRGLYEDLKTQAKDAGGILDKNLAERRETSAQAWRETTQAVDDAMRSIGDAIRPATDLVAKGITNVAQKLTSLSDGSQSVVFGITATVAGFVALKTALNGLKVVRGLANLGRGAALSRGGNAGTSEIKTGNKAVDAGLGVLGKLMGSSNDPTGGSGSEPQRVFVVNAGAFGSLGASTSAAGPGRGSRRSRRSRRRQSVADRTSPRFVPSAPSISGKTLGLAATEAGSLGKVVGTLGKVTQFTKRLPGGAVFDAGAMALDTAMNATTQDEKAEGYGSAAGNLGGSLAGAAAGAAIGSMVPVIGTAIGGAIGAILGGMGGESLGGFLGKKLFGGDDADKGSKPAGLGDVTRSLAEATPAPATAPVLAKVVEASKAAPPKVDQQFTFSPTIGVTVQGDVKDPARLAAELAPHLQRQFDDFARQAAARQMSDEPHI